MTVGAKKPQRLTLICQTEFLCRFDMLVDNNVERTSLTDVSWQIGQCEQSISRLSYEDILERRPVLIITENCRKLNENSVIITA